MAPPPSNQDLTAKAMAMYFASDQGKTTERTILNQKASAASKPLKWLAVLYGLGAVIIYLMLYHAIAIGIPGAMAMAGAVALLAVGYWALYIWSLSNPLPAAVTGLLLYTSVAFWASTIVVPGPHGPQHSSGIGISGIICIFLLSRSIYCGSKQRRMEIADRETPPGALPIIRPGIASAIWLYLALLNIVLIPRSLAMSGGEGMGDFLRIMAIMTIVIVAWAIASWQTILPAYIRVPEMKWFGYALLIGIATSLLAFVYGRVLTQSLGVPMADPRSVFLQHGLSMGAIIALVCLWPAIFEEMAFRGIIVPVLNRALTNWETILASGVMFMVLHLSVFSFPHLLCLGCALAYVRLRTGSIWPCVLMHFTHNFMCLWLT